MILTSKPVLLTSKLSTQKHRNPKNKHFGYTKISLKKINKDLIFKVLENPRFSIKQKLTKPTKIKLKNLTYQVTKLHLFNRHIYAHA